MDMQLFMPSVEPIKSGLFHAIPKLQQLPWAPHYIVLSYPEAAEIH